MQFQTINQSKIFGSLGKTDSRLTVCDHNTAAGFSTEGHNSGLVAVGLYAVSNELSKNRIYI